MIPRNLLTSGISPPLYHIVVYYGHFVSFLRESLAPIISICFIPGEVFAEPLTDRAAAVLAAGNHSSGSTNNGKPIALLTPIGETNLEETLSAVRRARTIQSVRKLQQTSMRRGTAELSESEIREEIDRARTEHS
jgi:antitoxin (DNA-binding transcriptional repressor) of toxin-antitoxin stability system